MSSENEDLEDAVSKFRVAESALRNFLKSGEDLRTAQQDLAEAEERNKQVYEDAKTRLERAQQDVSDTSSQIFRLADELTGIARDLGDATQVVRKFEPERMHQEISELKSGQNELREELSNRLHQEISELKSGQNELREELSNRLSSLEAAEKVALADRSSIRSALDVSRKWLVACTTLVAAAVVLILFFL